MTCVIDDCIAMRADSSRELETRADRGSDHAATKRISSMPHVIGRVPRSASVCDAPSAKSIIQSAIANVK